MEEELKIKSCTGKNLYVKKWIDKNRKQYKGVIQLVHGMQEQIEKYNEFATMLMEQGYIVIGHDQLGHGYTASDEEELGYFAKKDGWQKLVEDVHIIQNKIKKEYSKIPYIIFGHSMGSLIVRTYITKYKDNIDGIIISGTTGRKKGLITAIFLTKLIMLFKGEKYRSDFLEYLITGSFNKKFNQSEVKENEIINEKNELEKDEKYRKNFTVSAYLELLKGIKYLSKQKNIKNTPNIPILIFSGDKDPVGEHSKGVIRVYKMLEKAGNTNITIRLFKNGKHNMLNSENKNEVYRLILNWLLQFK